MYIAFVIGVFLWIIHVISANSVTLVLASAILRYKIRYR